MSVNLNSDVISDNETMTGTFDTSGNPAGNVLLADPDTLWDVSDSVRADEDVVLLAASGDDSDLVISSSKVNGSLLLTIVDADTATAETISVKAYLDSALTLESPAINPIDVETGVANVKGTPPALPDGTYLFKDIPHFGWHIEKSATTRTPTLTYVDG